MKKPRDMEVKNLGQDHTSKYMKEQGFNPGRKTPIPIFWVTMLRVYAVWRTLWRTQLNMLRYWHPLKQTSHSYMGRIIALYYNYIFHPVPLVYKLHLETISVFHIVMSGASILPCHIVAIWFIFIDQILISRSIEYFLKCDFLWDTVHSLKRF